MEICNIKLFNSDIEVEYLYEKGNQNFLSYDQPPDPNIFELGDLYWNGYKVTDYINKILEDKDKIYDQFQEEDKQFYYQNENISDLIRDIVEFKDFMEYIENDIYNRFIN